MMNIKQLVSFNSSFIIPHSSFPFPSFVRVNPQVPAPARGEPRLKRTREQRPQNGQPALVQKVYGELHAREILEQLARLDRKSTRLNSSHSQISYAVFCLIKRPHSSAIGVQPRRSAAALLITLIAAPASVIWEAVPALMGPSFAKAGWKAPSLASVLPRLT